MSTPAVTPEAPAVSTETAQEPTTTELLSNATPEELDNWWAKGEIPKTQSEKDAASAAEKDKTKSADTRAASAAATTQKDDKGPAQTKTPQKSENRFKKLSDENRELRDRLARLESAAQPAKTTPQETTESRPAADAAKTSGRPEPKVDDVDPKTKKPKYATWEDYQRDLRAWDREEAVRLAKEDTSKTEQARAQEQAKQKVHGEWNKRVEGARKEYPDWDEVMTDAGAQKDEHGQERIFIPEGSHLAAFFFDSERGQDVFYEVMKNHEKHAPIFARGKDGKFLMSAVRQIRELSRIEAALPARSTEKTEDGNSKDKTPSASPKIPPKLPPPATELGARRTAPNDEAEAALARGDTKAYMRIVNEREMKSSRR